MFVSFGNKRFIFSVCAIASVFLSAKIPTFADTVYWKGNFSDPGLGFYSTGAWPNETLPTASDDVVIDENYITTEGNGYLVDGFWNSDTTWNSLTLNYTNADKKINSGANGPVQITITTDLKS